MKLDLKAVILDMDDKPFKQPKNGELQPVTLGDVIVGALTSVDDKATPKEKIDKVMLAMRARDAEKKDLPFECDLDELNLIRETVGKNPFPVVVKRAYDHFKITGEK